MLNFSPFFLKISEWIHEQTDMVLFVQVAAIAFFTLIFIISVASSRIKKSEFLFIMLGLVTITLFRSFTLFADSYNPDEGMHLANAIALYDEFKLWQSTDTTTFGPVNAILIILLGKFLAFFGSTAGLTYFSLRLLNILLLDAGFVLFYKLLNKLVEKPVSYAVSMLFIIFYAFHFDADILAFNAEITYIFFAALALYLLYQSKCSLENRGGGTHCSLLA